MSLKIFLMAIHHNLTSEMILKPLSLAAGTSVLPDSLEYNGSTLPELHDTY